jgi:hypothetical protein
MERVLANRIPTWRGPPGLQSRRRGAGRQACRAESRLGFSKRSRRVIHKSHKLTTTFLPTP